MKYVILEVNNKNDRVRNLPFKQGELVEMSKLKQYAKKNGMTYERERNNYISKIQILDIHNNILIKAEA